MNNNYKKVNKVLWVILFANLLVAILKIIIGAIVKSISITADGYHSLTDGSSNIVGLIGIHFAAKPIDDDHPYGHKKFEMLAGLFIAGMLLFIGGEIIINAIDRFINPVVPSISFSSIIILFLTLIINIFVSSYEYRKGIKLNSKILTSDSMHTRSDIYVSLGVLITLICVKMGLPTIVDPISSLVVAIFIFYASYEIFKENSSILVDKAVIDTNTIRNIALSFEQVKETHNIRSRGSENDIYIDMHIMTEPNLSVEKSHELNHNIESRIKSDVNQNAHFIAHFEPFHDENEFELMK